MTLAEVKELVKGMATKEGVVHTKEEVDQYAAILGALDSAIANNDKLVKANADLSKSYSELAMHTTIGDSPKSVASEDIHKKTPTMEEFLVDWAKDNISSDKGN